MPQASPQRPASRRGVRQLSSAVRATGALIALTDTSWWPDDNEATFRNRQEDGMAALIAVATRAARYRMPPWGLTANVVGLSAISAGPMWHAR